MGLTLSHTSALRALRHIRVVGEDLGKAYPSSMGDATPIVGKRWSNKEFVDDSWKWQVPTEKDPLHVLIDNDADRLRTRSVVLHRAVAPLAPGSILGLDDRASIVCPELLFVQMAELLPLHKLVALGNELCGFLSRDPDAPQLAEPRTGIRAATSVEKLRLYVNRARGIKGIRKARAALEFVCDRAMSIPEVALATEYSLAVRENGYGMGPVELNRGIEVEGMAEDVAEGNAARRLRFPDLMFSFAPMGINYEGEGHLDLQSIVAKTELACLVVGKDVAKATMERDAELQAVRDKYVDDIRRNRQLLASGKIVLPLTKEDLYERGALDAFTRQLLQIAHELFGAESPETTRALDDSSLTRERNDQLLSLLLDGWDS